MRIEPGGRDEIGFPNALLCRLIGRAAGGDPPRVFTTVARHRRLFRSWLRFASRLMPFGTLPRRDCELAILRVAVLCGSDYEWNQHVRLGIEAGLSIEEIGLVAGGPDGPSWGSRDRALLRATDELVGEHRVSDQVWGEICRHLDERAMIELCFLVGNYVMVAGTLNALGVVPEDWAPRG